MSRLTATMLCDLRIQWRNGYYYAAAFLALFFILVLSFAASARDSWLPAEDLAWAMPVVVFPNLLTNTFYFLAGLVLLEKAEGTLQAQVVSPLSMREYLASKVATLTALAVAENVVIVAVVFGVGVRWPILLTGYVCAAVLYALCGFIAVARYGSINEFLMPSALYVALISGPLFPYFGLLESELWYLHPFQAPFVLIKAGFNGAPPWELVYGVTYSLFWMPILYWLCRRTYERHIVERSAGSQA